MVAVAHVMNATLVIPQLDKRSFWQDSRSYFVLYCVSHNFTLLVFLLEMFLYIAWDCLWPFLVSSRMPMSALISSNSFLFSLYLNILTLVCSNGLMYSTFSDIFDENHFIETLQGDLRIIKELPKEIESLPRARKHFTSWSGVGYYEEMTQLWKEHQACKSYSYHLLLKSRFS